MARADRYAYWRKMQPNLPASTALAWARYEEAMQAVLGRLGPWEMTVGLPYGAFAVADLDEYEGPYTIRAGIGDDDAPYDWGDIEPTQEERDNVRAFYVFVQVLDENGDELYHDGIGGVDAIDLPGYLQRDWEDAAAFALLEYLLAGAERFAAIEARERAEWEARDTITNGAS